MKEKQKINIDYLEIASIETIYFGRTPDSGQKPKFVRVRRRVQASFLFGSPAL